MAMIYVRRGNFADLPAIMTVINEARTFLREQQIPQWQMGYPDAATLRVDIQAHTNYVLIDNGEIAGTATLLFTAEPNYQVIDGSWQDQRAPYATIHRIAIASRFRGQHLAATFFSSLITIAALNGLQNVRFDTHRINHAMQALGKRFGFQFRGIIQVTASQDPERMAFELNLAGVNE